MAKENNNATVNNNPAPQPENQTPVNQENNQPADQQANNNPAPQPEEIQPPKKGVVKMIGDWVKNTTVGKVVAGTLLVGTGAAIGYVSGRVTGHTKGVMDTLSMLPDNNDDSQLAIEDHGDIDIDVDDIPDIDTSTIDI